MVRNRLTTHKLRTIVQDAWAEVEHELIYKANYSLLNEPIRRKLASLNASLTLSDIIFQEIRDYQNKIQQYSLKRQKTLLEKKGVNGPASILNGINGLTGQAEKNGPTPPIKHKNPMEKLIFEALRAHSNNQFSEAIQLYNRILHMKPNEEIRSTIYNHRGMAYFVISKYLQSIKDFTKAIEYNDNNFRALNNRGTAFRMLQKYRQSLDDFNHSMEINPFQVEGFYNRALVFFDLHDFPKALGDCKKVLNIRPDYIPAQHLKSVVEGKILS